ncbi:small nuclear ribonucleoprotein-associated protein B'-like [Serinus canaria]|uniref:small nuclear ribonucleoprotein-associated protein B'-like n=1 Tax=Serinus canaria TaxID=9135 RepID=UPI0021CCB5EC|nr:small nuclear ribonucleoprotein-associated protein B'-like [Serinus canaria]
MGFNLQTLQYGCRQNPPHDLCRAPSWERCVIRAEAASRRAVRRTLPRLKRRRRWGKDGDERRITKKSGSAQGLPSPAHPSGPACLGSPRRGLSLSELAPGPRGAAPSRHRAAEIPAARPDPARGAERRSPRPGLSGQPPALSRGALPRPPSLPPLLRGRAVTSPPATSHAPQAESQHPAASRTRTPGPGDNEQPQLTSSAGASRVRGRFLCPFSFPFSSA